MVTPSTRDDSFVGDVSSPTEKEGETTALVEEEEVDEAGEE